MASYHVSIAVTLDDLDSPLDAAREGLRAILDLKEPIVDVQLARCGSQTVSFELVDGREWRRYT